MFITPVYPASAGSRKSFHQIARALITPDEVMRLKSPVKAADDTITEPGDMLVFVAGHAPILGTQSLYFRDPVFRERSQMPAPSGETTGTKRALRPFEIERS